MMNKQEQKRFAALRKMVMDAIKRELEIDSYCKSYEGTFEWYFNYPNYFDDRDATQGPDGCILTLHCYVLGPSRHYKWLGKTPTECMGKAEEEITAWIMT